MYKNRAKHIVYITNTKFQCRTERHAQYKTWEKSWLLKTLRKESIFLYQNRHNLQFFRPIGVFTSLGVAIFRVTLRDRAEAFVRRCSVKLGLLRNFAKFTGKHLCQSHFFNKVTGLRPATLLKKRLWHRWFPFFCEISKNTFFYRTPLVAASDHAQIFAYKATIYGSNLNSKKNVTWKKSLILCDVCYSALLKTWKNDRTSISCSLTNQFPIYLFKLAIETLEKDVKYVQS